MQPRHPKRSLARHAIPTRWLMTDERLGDGLWAALRRLPHGGGVVFRHYATPAAERRRLFVRVLRIARARGLTMVRAGDQAMPGEMGVHGAAGWGLVTFPAHDRREAIKRVRAGATLLFVSPIFVTRSHPGARPLRHWQAAAIARGLPVTVIALGGMDEKRFRSVRRLGFHGYAGIDCWDR
jgi:thiamine-phosphate pyrophosphorylase